MDKKVIADLFRVFGSRECKGSSPLYEHLSEKIAADDELLQLASYVRQGQPIPNLFFGAVHYLLLKGKDHELKEYYGSLIQDTRENSTAFATFKDFCMQYRNDIIPILKDKLVQTNEVRRCAYLYPAFCYMYEKTKMPLALIEIGTSAGLQLMWDKFSYSYNGDEVYGDVHSKLLIHSEIQGNRLPLLLTESPPVTTRIGIDLHVNDLNDPDDFLWLKALIWPEHTERLNHFKIAASCVKEQALELVEGNGVKLLSEITSTIPRDSVICVFHTHVANQIPEDDKHELVKSLRKLGKTRDVFHLYNNMWDLDLHLDYYRDGEEHKLTIAETDGHGRWFHWML